MALWRNDAKEPYAAASRGKMLVVVYDQDVREDALQTVGREASVAGDIYPAKDRCTLCKRTICVPLRSHVYSAKEPCLFCKRTII